MEQGPPVNPDPPPTPSTDSARPGTKRKRVTLACHRCRSKKARCNGLRPTCSNCEAADEQCEWPDPEKDGRKHKARKNMLDTLEGGREGFNPNHGAHGAPNRAQELPLPEGTLAISNAVSKIYDDYQYAGTPSVLRHHDNAQRHPGESRSVSKSDRTFGMSRGATYELHSSSSQDGVASFTSSSPLDMLLAAAYLPNTEIRPSRNAPSVTESQHPTHSSRTAPLNTSTVHASNSRPPTQIPANLTTPITRALSSKVLYYRSLGPTAVNSTLQKLTLTRTPIQTGLTSPPSSEHSLRHVPLDGAESTQETSHSISEPVEYAVPDLNSAMLPSLDSPYDVGQDIPRRSHLAKLVPLFFSRMGSHFPFMTENSVLQSLDSGDPLRRLTSPLIVNTICALGARFSDTPPLRSQNEQFPATYGEPFAEKAKALLLPLLGLPTFNTVASLLLLAHYSFGMGSEGEVWSYSGMAIRMAVDMGLHQRITDPSEPGTNSQPQDRLLWWSCFTLDRTLAFETGRPVTVKDREIHTSLPTNEDIQEVAMADGPTPSPVLSPTSPFPFHAFPFHVRMVNLYGALAETLSTWQSTSRLSDDIAPGSNKSLVELEHSITDEYNSFPEDVAFNATNLKAHSLASGGPIFLALHLWYNTVIILLHKAPLIHPDVTAARATLHDRLAVVNNSCQAITNIFTSADLVDQSSYLASPSVAHCFLIAANAWVQDYRIRVGRAALESSPASLRGAPAASQHSSAGILGQMALKNLTLCKNALSQQVRYWMGVRRIHAVVEKYASSQQTQTNEKIDLFLPRAEWMIFNNLFRRIIGKSLPNEIGQEELEKLLNSLVLDHGRTSSEDEMAMIYSLASFAGLFVN